MVKLIGVNDEGRISGDGATAVQIASASDRLALAAKLSVPRFNPEPSTVAVDVTSSAEASGQAITEGVEVNVHALRSQLGAYPNPSMWRIEYGLAPLEIMVDGSTGAEFEIRGAGLNALAARTVVWVDDRPLPIVETPGAGTNTAWFFRMKFSDPGRHRVRIHQLGVAVEGIRTRDANTTLSPVVRRPTVGAVTDSFGGSTDYVAAAETPLQVVEERLNVNLLRSTIGGSGYMEDGSWVRFAHPERLAPWGYAELDAALFFGSINDPVGASEGDYKAAATQTWDAYADLIPGRPLVVFGVQPSSAYRTVEDPGAARLNHWLYEAAQAHPSVTAFVDMIGTARAFSGQEQPAWEPAANYQAGDIVRFQGAHYACVTPMQYAPPSTAAFWRQVSWVFTGTGKRGEPTQDGNRDALLGEDGTHPTALGAHVFGQQMSRALVEALSSPLEFTYVN